MKQTKILFVAAECAGFAVAGGLADVAGSLPKAIMNANKSFKVKVVLPLYKKIMDEYGKKLKFVGCGNIDLAWRSQYVGVFTLKKDGRLKFGFYGTYELVFDIVKLLVCELGLPDNKITNKGTVSFITFCRYKDIINFYNYIYYDQNVICLKRKKEKFDTYLPKIINKVS